MRETKFYIQMILVFSFMAVAVIIGLAIESHFRPLQEKYMGLVCFGFVIISTATSLALKSIDKRITDLEDKFKKDN
jgi:hypothetical protein